MKPVSRRRTSKVGPGRFNQTMSMNQEKTKEGGKLNINTHKLFCVLLEISFTHEPSSDTSIGERFMGNKKIPTHTQYLSMVMITYERGE